MSVSKQSRKRGEILKEIMRYHREQLPKVMRQVPLADLRALTSVAPPTTDLATALHRRGVSLIAECKKASPSKGLIASKYNAARLAESYVRGGASAISVLTDGRHFQGSLADLRDVKETVLRKGLLQDREADPRWEIGVPVLRKDFIFHPYQVHEARAAGADAILLIAAVLAVSELAELMALASELGMTALVEIHTEKELEDVLPLSPKVVGINNRNLDTFEVDFENTGRLRGKIPRDIIVVAESGIQSTSDVRRLRAMGVDAALVGESLVRSRDPQTMVQELVQSGRGR